jgi:hypothetical protein
MQTRTGRISSAVATILGAALLSILLVLPALGADRPSVCPGKLGPLKFSSGEVTGPDERFAKARCFYRSDDWDKQATIRAAWIPADQPDATLNLETTYCLTEDEKNAGDGQYGEGTRTGRVFPTTGERFVLGTYLATPKGAPTTKIVKAARVLAASYAEDAAVCPPIPEAVSEGTAIEEPPAAASGETFTDDEIFAGIFDIADDLNAAPAPTFDREAVATCLGTDPGDMSVALIEESPHARMVNNACAVLPLLLADLPAEQATETTLFIVALLVADEQRRQAEAAAAE